jgi:hypothetical protein
MKLFPSASAKRSDKMQNAETPRNQRCGFGKEAPKTQPLNTPGQRHEPTTKARMSAIDWPIHTIPTRRPPVCLKRIEYFVAYIRDSWLELKQLDHRESRKRAAILAFPFKVENTMFNTSV